MGDVEPWLYGGALVIGVAVTAWQWRARQRRLRHLREEFEEGLRDPVVRRAIIANLEAAAAAAEQRAMENRRRFDAREEAQELHLRIALLLIEDSELTEAERHLEEVPAAHALGGPVKPLRAQVVQALEAARARRDGAVPLR